jgi:hypothetical protein
MLGSRHQKRRIGTIQCPLTLQPQASYKEIIISPVDPTRTFTFLDL